MAVVIETTGEEGDIDEVLRGVGSSQGYVLEKAGERVGHSMPEMTV